MTATVVHCRIDVEYVQVYLCIMSLCRVQKVKVSTWPQGEADAEHPESPHARGAS
jgi:hypothetical protein